MAYRVVTGQFFRAGTTPWVDGEVWFTLQKGSYSVDAHYPADSIKLLTDANGRISVNLWVSEEAQTTTNWLCRQPSGEVFKFGVPAGTTPIAIETLRGLGSPPVVATPSLGALIDQRIAAHNINPAAHPGLGGGGPGLGGGDEYYGFHAGDATPIDLGALYTGLLAKFAVCVEIAFSGVLRFEVGSEFYEFPADTAAWYEIHIAKRCVNAQPRLLMSGALVGETGYGFVRLSKGQVI